MGSIALGSLLIVFGESIMRAKRIAILLACIFTLNSVLPVAAAEAVEAETADQTEMPEKTETSDIETEEDENLSDTETIEIDDDTVIDPFETDTPEDPEEPGENEQSDAGETLSDEDPEEGVEDPELSEEEGAEDEFEETGDAKWTLEGSGSDMTLRIFGAGAMPYLDNGEDGLNGAGESVTTLIVEGDVTELHGWLGDFLPNLQKAVIGSGITEIPDNMFWDCEKLTSVSLPGTVKAIGHSAFSGCFALKTITLPDGLEEIRGHAFYGSGLEKVTIPGTVVRYRSEDDDEYVSTGYVFSDCMNLREVVFSAGCREVSEGMFSGCEWLETVRLASSITSIGENAFGGCVKITSVDLPSGLKELGGGAFSGCSSLKSITIPAGITHLGNTGSLDDDNEEYYSSGSIFQNCTSLKEADLPAGLKAIGNYVFNECTSLQSIDIPDSVEYIGDYAFDSCTNLEECELPASLRELGAGAFSSCGLLKGFTFPKGFRKLGEGAVNYTDAEYLTIPASLESVEGDYLELSSNATIFFGGSEEKFLSLFGHIIETNDREWEDYDDYQFFTRYQVYYDLPDGPIRAESLEVDIPDTINSYERTLIDIHVLPENASIRYVNIDCNNPFVIDLEKGEDDNAYMVGLQDGTATITVKILDGSGLTYRKKVKVIDDKKYDSYKYNIAFNGNGSTSGKMSNLTKVPYRKNQPLTANAFKRTGHQFTGWNTARDGSGDAYSNKEVVSGLTRTNGGTVTLYAQWEIIPYTISYNLGSDDAVNAEANPTSYDVTTAVTLQDPTRPFSTFQGWYSDAKFKTKVTVIKKGSTGNKTFYAKWTTNKYSISFKGNGSTSGKMSDLTGIVYNADKTLTANAFKRNGYNFTGWNTAADGSGTSYANKEVVNGLSTENGAKITLYAQWEIIPYTITYVLGSDDAVNAEANPSSYDVETAVTLQAPTRPFSTFQGWYSDKKLKTKVTTIKKGSTGNRTFYAKWTTNKYTITFKGNGSTSGKMKDLTGIVYNADKTLTANAFKRTGYHFVEWNTAADGSGDSYANKQVVNGLSTENGVKVALYAIWEKDIYNITYNLNGADAVNAEANPSTYDVEMTVNLEAPTREHYTFSGWYSDKKLKKKVAVIKKGSTGNKTFFAKWTPNKYNIAYNGNGSTGGKMKNTTGVEYGKSKALAGNAYSRKGYKFTGWNTEADGSGTAYANKASVRNLAEDNGVTVMLYAQWELETYKITYSMGSGAVNAEANPADYTIVTETITLEEPARPGYIFGGWYSDSKLKKKATGIATGSTGNKTFYAKWTAIRYTIVFDGNGATSGSMKKISNVAYGTSKTLAGNGFKKTGATFLGWSLTPDGEVKYKNKAKGVKDLTTENGATVTLYAVWSN